MISGRSHGWSFSSFSSFVAELFGRYLEDEEEDEDEEENENEKK